MSQAHPTAMHGGQILANALVRQGVEIAFGVPGESFLPLLDGLVDHHERLRFITCRQEGGGDSRRGPQDRRDDRTVRKA